MSEVPTVLPSTSAWRCTKIDRTRDALSVHASTTVAILTRQRHPLPMPRAVACAADGRASAPAQPPAPHPRHSASDDDPLISVVSGPTATAGSDAPGASLPAPASARPAWPLVAPADGSGVPGLSSSGMPRTQLETTSATRTANPPALALPAQARWPRPKQIRPRMGRQPQSRRPWPPGRPAQQRRRSARPRPGLPSARA
jgi:hypothetical protein